MIEQILQIDNDSVLDELETFMNQRRMHVANRRSFKERTGVLNDEEVGNLEKIIKEDRGRN